jgi:hypothetical protein
MRRYNNLRAVTPEQPAGGGNHGRWLKICDKEEDPGWTSQISRYCRREQRLLDLP